MSNFCSTFVVSYDLHVIMKHTLILLALLIPWLCHAANEYLLEAEQFATFGGWTHTSQYMDQMGSPYLQAHGIGTPVADAQTTITLPKKGTYHVYVRTYNWTSPWTDKKGAGQFLVKINDTALPDTLGCTGHQWEWQYAGAYKATNTEVKLALCDLTGFDGRCDAIYFTMDKHPDLSNTAALRQRLAPSTTIDRGHSDLVVIGGGLSGMCAAVAAARLGLKTALIHDRAVLGGNNSSEVRVHTSGMSTFGLYPQLGMLMREFGHGPMINGENDGRLYCDSLKCAFVEAEPNLTVYMNEYVNAVQMQGDRIASVASQNTLTGTISTYIAPLFADCTGDACVGYLAGADYEMEKPGMGASVLWNTLPEAGAFPLFEYGMNFSEESVHPLTNGEWTWETGMNRDQIQEAEYIRDYGMLVAYSNWSYLKNRYSKKDEWTNRRLSWVSTVAGKRESRRLMGDHVLTKAEIMDSVVWDDPTLTLSWPVDLHYPDTNNSRFVPGEEYIAISIRECIPLYPMPYRCLYSRNISNLFMAGRDISVTHEALGAVRVMRTTAMMGEVVGMAAAVCHQHASLPRSVYTTYLEDLKTLMQQGVGKDLPDNQAFFYGRSRCK